jgi:hypothetical protein
MILREVLAVAVLILFPGTAMTASSGAPPSLDHLPPMVFYVAKGAPDACGPGCDSWIALEGMVDAGAADRFRKFLRRQKDRHLPMYFSSPGGNLDQALAMGRMLREEPTIARVARTVVKECGSEPQTGEACLELKRSGRVLEAELAEQGAMCNSACPYLILGSTTREIAPNTVLAVHSPKVILSIRGKPSEKQRAEAVQRGMERANRIVAIYLARMGVDRGLLDLAKTVKFESPHVLARDEIFRFGIDRREFVETPWQFENAGRAFVSKIAVARTSNGATFRTTQLRLFCDGKDRARLIFVREFDKSAIGTSSVALIANSEKPLTFAVLPQVGGFEIRSAAIASDALKNLFAVPHLQVGEITLMPDGKSTQAILEIETRGLEGAWTQLSATCAAPPSSARRTIDVPGIAKAPAL